jgi:hypothetical protein
VIEAELAKQRQQKAGELFGKGKDSLSSNELELSEGQARDVVAEKIGLINCLNKKGESEVSCGFCVVMVVS